MAGSQFMPDSEREGWSAFDLSHNVTFVHFSKALLTVIKHGSGNLRKSKHMLTCLSFQDGPWFGGRGPVVGGAVDFVQDI